MEESLEVTGLWNLEKSMLGRNGVELTLAGELYPKLGVCATIYGRKEFVEAGEFSFSELV